jgi:hypothetical protein
MSKSKPTTKLSDFCRVMVPIVADG